MGDLFYFFNRVNFYILNWDFMKSQNIKKGFTLIELLVVITIIGILAVGGVSVFTTQLQGARDSGRIKDLKLMEGATHQYFSDYSAYPSEWGFTGAIDPFVSKDLVDPKRGQSICWRDNSWTPANDAGCEGYYVMDNDSFGLQDAAFKLGIRFEKQVNYQQKAATSYDGGSDDDFFEAFAGEGSSAFDLTTDGVVVY